jgi:hypothetical protein
VGSDEWISGLCISELTILLSELFMFHKCLCRMGKFSVCDPLSNVFLWRILVLHSWFEPIFAVFTLASIEKRYPCSCFKLEKCITPILLKSV